MRRPAPWLRHRSGGQSLTEFVLVVPLLLLLFAGAADLGRAAFAFVAIENGVKEGAFFGARSPLCVTDSAGSCADPRNVTWRVRNELETLRNPDGSELSPTAECLPPGLSSPRSSLRDCVPGDTYRVSVTYPFQLLTPIIADVVGGTIDLKASATAAVLNLAFDPTPGATVAKYVDPSNAENGVDIVAKCTEPDDHDASGFYRSPCLDTSTPDPVDVLYTTFLSGKQIRYDVLLGNSGGQPLHNVSVGDSTGSMGCTPPTTWNVGYAQTCQYTRTAPNVPAGQSSVDYKNVVTVSAAEINTASDFATVKVQPPPPDWSVHVYASTFALGDDGDGVPEFGKQQALTLGLNGILTDESVWYLVTVRNVGGATATGVSITSSLGALPFGQNVPTTAVCDAKPTTMAAGSTFTCRYRVAITAPGNTVNTIVATATNAVPTSRSDSATATATNCTGSNRLIPNLIGLQKAQAQAAWTAAGFPAGGLTVWNGNPNAATVTQSRSAYSCVATSATMTITRTTTP